MIITVSKKGASRINEALVSHLLQSNDLLGHICMDGGLTKSRICTHKEWQQTSFEANK
jgi:hypothetical protein